MAKNKNKHKHSHDHNHQHVKADFDIKVDIEEISTVKKRLTITVPKETVKSEIDSAYRNLKATASLAGFRKGAVPRGVLQAKFGESVEADVSGRLVEQSYTKAVHDAKLLPTGNPEIDGESIKLNSDADFTFVAITEVSPEVKVEGYIGMELTAESTEVTDSDIDNAITRLQESRVEYVEVDRGADVDDLVNVDFEASVDGVPVKDIKAEDFPVIIGSGNPFPGFDDALKGVVKDAAKEVTLQIPETYQNRDLAEKDALFKITVRTVKEKRLPEIDDEFAKDLNEESLLALKKKVAADLVELKIDTEKERVKNEILDKLIEDHKFELPEGLVNRYHSVILNNIVDNMKAGSIKPEDANLDPDALKAKYRGEAERRVREDIILDTISEAEGIEVPPEEVEKAVKHLAEQRQIPYEALMGRIEQEGSLSVIEDGLKHETVFDLIIAKKKA
jgi:trigger factor